MKNISIFSALAVVITAGTISAFTLKDPSVDTDRHRGSVSSLADKGFAVVELFTSEGCSSCPPADAAIEKLQKQAGDRPVYVLAYHVDYWDRLGWKDPFSSATFSNRQNNYAEWLNLSSVYTPQVIVNGRTEFVGSQEGKLANVVANALGRSSVSELALTYSGITGNKAKFKYTSDGTGDHETLVLALVRRTATVNVKRGENSGRTLSHVQIVSNIQSLPLSLKAGEATIALPDNFSAKDHELIAFVQNTATGEISAAAKAEFAGKVGASN